jgi:hypothetical protein
MAASISADAYASDAFDVSADTSGNVQFSTQSLYAAQHEQHEATSSIALRSTEENDQYTHSRSNCLDVGAEQLQDAAEVDELLSSFGIPLHAFEEAAAPSIQLVNRHHYSSAWPAVAQSSCRHAAFTELAQRVRAQSATVTAAMSNSDLQQQQQQQLGQLCDALVPAECAQALLQQIAVNRSCKHKEQQQQLHYSTWPLHGPLFCVSHRLSHASGCKKGRCMPPLSRRCPVPAELVGR